MKLSIFRSIYSKKQFNEAGTFVESVVSTNGKVIGKTKNSQNAEIISNKYPSLNGLRAISILLVIFYHLQIKYHILSPDIINYFPLLVDGQLGVNIFFVISGFLITSLLLREESSNTKISLKHFYIRRTLRIFPAYYFLLLAYFIISRFGYIYISNRSWLTALTYTKYFNWRMDWYTAHAWSLSIEEHFYLIWPLIFLVAKKSRKIFIYAIIPIVPLFRLYFYYHPISWVNDLTIFYRFDAIAFGCLFALHQKRLLRHVSNYWNLYFIVVCILLLLLPFIGILNSSFKLDINLFIIAFGGTYGTIANILITFIVMFSVFGPKSRWFTFLNSRVMNQIGLWSYSLYLWQQFFIVKKDYVINELPLNMVLLFATAILSYYMIEKPFLRLKSKFI
jgi:peptidoglycan/LPS O-acetylase OafA/YrhL